jgi:hypothetical protein
MLASIPASMVNQKSADLGIPNRFTVKSSRFSAPFPKFASRLAAKLAGISNSPHWSAPVRHAVSRRHTAATFDRGTAVTAQAKSAPPIGANRCKPGKTAVSLP